MVEAPVKVANDSLELQEYLRSLATGTPVAVEASGGWYWFVDALEEAGLDVRLVHPLEAKKRMPGPNKTDTTGPAPAHDDIEEPHPRGASPLRAV